MSKSKKKSNKKNKKKSTTKEETGKFKWETTLHGYPMTGPFTPGKTEVWYCDHKKCQYTQHGLYRRYKIENWRSTKFGKNFILCDGCVRQYKKEAKKAPQSQSSASNVNVKVNINGGMNPGFQPGMAPPQQQYIPPQPYGYGPPQAYGAPPQYMNGYPPQMGQGQPMQPMQPYAQPMQMGQGQPQPPLEAYAQPQAAYDGQPMVKPAPPTEPPPQGAIPTGMEQKMDRNEDIVVNGVVKQGWMMKKGDIVKSWKKRYFVLKSNRTLNYYESDNAVMVKGTCPLDKVKSVMKKSGQSFEIETSKRKWCFACKDTDTRDGWVKKIKSVAGV